MRVVQVGSRRYTEVRSTDSIGAGNANHAYEVVTVPQTGNESAAVVATISFQNGPIKESGINGCHNEDLIAIVIDRLRAFQSSAYSCRENALALTKLEESLHWLKHRTAERQARGVEGTHAV